MKYILLRFFYIFFWCFCLSWGVFADAGDFNLGGLYITGTFDLYMDADNLSAGPMPGMRGGAGWEFPFSSSSLSLGLETGFFNVRQDESSPIPATFSILGVYAFHFNKHLSLDLGAAGGGLFSPAGSTNDAMFFFGPRLFGEWAFAYRPDGGRSVSLYLGGGADLSFGEQEKTLILPLVEAGLRLRFGKPAAAPRPNPGSQAPAGEMEPENAAVNIENQQAAENPPDEEFPSEMEPSSEWEQETGGSDFVPAPEPEYVPDELAAVEPAPEPIPNEGPSVRSDLKQLPRGNRPLVRLPDGRRGFILEECTVYFGPNQTEIQPRERAKLRRAIQLLTEFPASRFIVAGYTAWAGTELGRSIISWERARNVTDYMVRQGIRAGRMEVHWYGAAQPAVPNTNSANMAQNRRMEIIVLED